MGSELTLTHPHITLRRRGAAIRLASRAAYVKSEATRRADRLTDLEAPRLCPQSARLLHRHDNSTWVHELLKKPVMGLQQHTHNSTTMAQTAYEFDHETTKGFSLLTSLRQHFAALRQQNADVLAPQPKTTLDDLCAPYWVQPYDLQHNDHKIAVLGCQALASSRPQCSNVQPAKPTKQPMRSPVFLCNSKVRRHKQRQHHRRHQQQEKHHEHVLHNNHPISHLLAEDPQGAQHVQLEPACSSAPQEAVSYEAAATEALGQALRVHHLKDGSTPSIGHTSSINQRCSLQQLHNSTPSSPYPGAVAIETYTTQTLAHDSHVGCIRAQPRLMWQDSLKPTDSIPDRIDLCLRLNQGRPSAHTFQIAADLSKAGQLRTQNLHAAVRASLQLMHRFVVRPSAIAHMGVFTTGISFATPLLTCRMASCLRRCFDLCNIKHISCKACMC